MDVPPRLGLAEALLADGDAPFQALQDVLGLAETRGQIAVHALPFVASRYELR
jgi:hypothetical protein